MLSGEPVPELLEMSTVDEDSLTNQARSATT